MSMEYKVVNTNRNKRSSNSPAQKQDMATGVLTPRNTEQAMEESHDMMHPI